MRGILLGAAALAIPVCLLGAEHTENYQRTFQLGSGARKLVVEILTGDVVVIGDSANDLRVSVKEWWENADDRNQAKLEMTQEGNTVRLVLDGPFKREHRRRMDSFRHDLEIHAPRDIELDIRTLNGKALQAHGTRGAFKIRTLNSAVEMTDVAGSGSVETLNGPLTVRFAENPAEPSTFKTLNGPIDVAFQPGLSADIGVHTLNGDLYTDFDVTTPAGGSLAGRNRQIRIGSGGTTHKFHTLNGVIKIRKSGK